MFTIPSGASASIALMIGAAVAAYVASVAAAGALGSDAPDKPGRRAGIHAVISGIIAVAAVLRKPMLADVAVGVPFAAAVAILTLGLGVVLCVATVPQGMRVVETSPEATRRRLWAFVLPTALLALLIGFTGQVTLRHGLFLAVNGLALFAGWGMVTHRERDPDAEPAGWRWLAQLILAGGLALVAGQAAVEAAAGLAAYSPVFRPGVAAALTLGPAVVLPMLPPLATLSETGRRDEAISAIVMFVLLNLCGVLPAVVGARELQVRFSPVQYASTMPVSEPHDPLAFPLTVWRMDAVLLAVVGMLLLPAGLGRWSLGRVEGFVLVLGYVAYLFLTLLISHGV